MTGFSRSPRGALQREPGVGWFERGPTFSETELTLADLEIWTTTVPSPALSGGRGTAVPFCPGCTNA